MKPSLTFAQLSLNGEAGVWRCILCLSAIALFLNCAPTSALAQNDMDPSLPGSSFEITGQVRSPDGRKAIQFVDVRLSRMGGGLVDQRTTDSNGTFRFSRLVKGQYTITATAPGYRITPQQVDINRFIPRVHLLLQLEVEGETFRSRSRPGEVVDVNVPEKARSEFEKGKAALTQKKVADGILHLEKAITFHKDYYEAQTLLAGAYMDQEKWEKASSTLHRALDINPSSVDAMISLGEVYRRQKKYEDGEKVVQAAVKLDDKSWLGRYTLGRIYWEKNDLVNAGKQIGLAIQLEPRFPDSRLLAGNIFVKAGLPQNAVIEYEEYLRLEPNGKFAGEIRELLPKLKSLKARKKS